MSYDYDLFVIGGGSGGIATARRAAGYGAKVGLAEFNDLGGTCVNRGCIPKKLMVYASNFPEWFEDAQGYGWGPVHSTFDWHQMITAVNNEVERLNGVYQRMLDKAGVEQFRAYAKLVDPHTLEVGNRKVTADKILIAVGGHPYMPEEVSGIEHAIVSDDMFHLKEQPKRIIILGGGYIGVEFACIMNGLGSQVTQIIRHKEILRGFDEEIRSGIQEGMQQHGIQVLSSRPVNKIEKTPEGLQVEGVTADVVLAAVGRRPNLNNLGLENAGVDIDRGAIAVDEYSRTTQENIFAVGDCTNRLNLTPVAINEGRAVADTEFGGKEQVMSYQNVPTAVFSTPEAATVGLPEAEAREQYGETIKVYRARFKSTYHSLTGRDERTIVKLVVDEDSDRVLGAHMVGEHAGEIVQGVAIAVKMGATKAQFDATLGIHPSTAEEFVTLR
ncbi:MAG: glutathione-disulfide reductase [Cyanobacteria bacterium QS_7_48_42]|nr:MAG: glutathione-disulfide reductase [Cyanobacteria bacterium QS_3_48_167]PSO89966.1 MAG: glutathione-disulfide reductase [Cyanobacteria bacterium QS_6_48_18]PSO92292.1 MAG: glutathione-disulfide reductase [Cyanobacteria bacterium QS_9_48_30]PSP01655.1 MAG: glutathione-disulfide reductase [Cyanobacteria bacterium QS_7_48_42]PSP04134.1 MAG: glutathione-disulfide reductase [Cyanobacteria bacterium SW_12_48_29]PSP09130.1 MAG: glutathione-disulfide reductase [Cyanobacteria bacterium SW_7_48_12]